MSLLGIVGRGCYAAAALGSFRWGLAIGVPTSLGLVAAGAFLTSLPRSPVRLAGE